jgi:RNA polymerase sigma-70 factor (ECF subfamily)
VTSAAELAHHYQAHRAALTGYVTSMVARAEVAEELVQETAVRALQAEALPGGASEIRAWLFRVATNLAIDHLRRHATWRETVLDEAKGRAGRDAGFVAESRLLRGSPETAAIARDHLAVCFACTSRNLRPEESAALLLKEVYGFTVEEVARVMDASFGQAKAWIQSARASLTERYAASCALVSQTGACFQCVELDRFFDAGRGDPLEGTPRDLDARLQIVRERAEQPLGRWHHQMMRLVAEVLGGP